MSAKTSKINNSTIDKKIGSVPRYFSNTKRQSVSEGAIKEVLGIKVCDFLCLKMVLEDQFYTTISLYSTVDIKTRYNIKKWHISS